MIDQGGKSSECLIQANQGLCSYSLNYSVLVNTESSFLTVMKWEGGIHPPRESHAVARAAKVAPNLTSSGLRPNVRYDVGLYHASTRPYKLLCPIHFNFRLHVYISYLSMSGERGRPKYLRNRHVYPSR
jgi:hypothetical protein